MVEHQVFRPCLEIPSAADCTREHLHGFFAVSLSGSECEGRFVVICKDVILSQHPACRRLGLQHLGLPVILPKGFYGLAHRRACGDEYGEQTECCF
ncbi:MAG: hypothetical protein KBT05_05175 [Bacteroidales bacterium]|nr:hypothetical protein [Candidatus Cryptobacteroides caccocaballi]